MEALRRILGSWFIPNNGIVRRITLLWIKSIACLNMNFKKSDGNSIELVLQVPHKAVKPKRKQQESWVNNFPMSEEKSNITNKITGIDIIQKSYVIFSKGTLPRTISNNQSKLQNRPKCRNVSKLDLPMSNSASENVIRFADIDLL